MWRNLAVEARGDRDPRDMMSRESPPHLILMGNPGVGMATILNGLLGGVYFHWRSPVDVPLRTLHIRDSFYSDTPSLYNASLRDAAVHQVVAFLRSGLPCRLVFVCVLEENTDSRCDVEKYGISMSDIDLMVAVLRTAATNGVEVAHRTSVIFNKVADMDWIARPLNREALENILSHSPIFDAHPVSNVTYLPHIPAAVGKRNFFLRDFTQYRNFFNSAPVIRTCLPPAGSLVSPTVPDVFISHAGPDKIDIAFPLHDQLVARGIRVFLDKTGLRPGDRGEAVMLAAMRSAQIGVFIVSAEFAGRQWTLRELATFLERRKHADETGQIGPVIIPVFYRLHVRQCRSERLYKHGEDTGRTIFDQGFFDEERQKEMSTSNASKYMKQLATFTGIENDELAKNDRELTSATDKAEHQARRERLLNRIIESVDEHVKKLSGAVAAAPVDV